jgi:hypothetical protein
MAKGKTHSTHAGMGQLDAILAGAASGPPDRAKVMEITLKLRADSGNSAVLKQLSEQVRDASRKAIQEAEHLGEALVKKAHGWAKEMGEAITKSLEKAAEQREKAEQEAKLGSASASAEKKPAGREMPAHPEPDQAKNAATPKESSHAPEQSSEKKTEKKEEKPESIGDKLGTLLEKGKSAYDHLKEAKSADNDAVKRVVEGFAGAKDAKESIKAGVDVFNRLKDVATAGKPIAEVGFKGMAANLGNAAVAGVGGWGTIAGAAHVAGIGAVAVAGGVALHDGFKLLLNKVGFLGGNFDTLSGTVMDWNESTKRSAEIEKKIAETQEAHHQALEQMQRNQQNTRSVYEARARIEESEKFQKESASMVSVGGHYAKRLGLADPEHVGTERDLQKRDKEYATDDRRLAEQTYAAKFEEKQREQEEAADTAGKTKQRNDERKAKALGPVDLQEQVLQEEKAVKLANELRDLAKDRTAELQSQLAAMDQQVRAAEHQVAAAKEQVKAERDKANADRAQLSMLSEDQQKTATNILKKLNETKHLSREDALTLQKLGVTKGRIGTTINETLAQGISPEFAKQFKEAGGEEGLDKAQQHLTESTDHLAAAQKQAQETLEKFMDAVWDFAGTAELATAALRKNEDTKADKEGYSHPGDLRPGERPKETQGAVKALKEAIQASQADFAAAIKEIGDAMLTGTKSHAANLRGVAQQLNQAQKH